MSAKLALQALMPYLSLVPRPAQRFSACSMDNRAQRNGLETHTFRSNAGLTGSACVYVRLLFFYSPRMLLSKTEE